MHKILAFFLLCFAACSIDSSAVPDVGMMLATDGAVSAPHDGGTIGGRISVPQYRVDGVSLTQLTFYDRTLDTYCFPRKTTAGLRCVPNGVFLLSYADAGCTQPAGTHPSCQAVTYGTTADIPADACDQGNYHYYGKSGATCVALPVPANTSLYAADTEVDPATFAEVTEVR